MLSKVNSNFLENEKGSILIFRLFYYLTFAFLLCLPMLLSFKSSNILDRTQDLADFYCKQRMWSFIIYITLLFLIIVEKLLTEIRRRRISKKDSHIKTSLKSVFTNLFIPKDYWLRLFVYFQNCYKYAYENQKITKFRFFSLYILSFVVLVSTFISLFFVDNPALFMFIGISVWFFMLKSQKLLETSWCKDKVGFNHPSLNKTILFLLFIYGIAIPAFYSPFFNILLPFLYTNASIFRVFIFAIVLTYLIPRVPSLVFGLKK